MTIAIRNAAWMALVLSALLAGPASAQSAAPSTAAMPGMTMPAPAAEASPASKAFQAADDRMMHGMSAPRTGDTDQDFVAGMLPHHQGAVEMAKVELQYGKNPQMRKLARNIVAAQDREIAEMKAWQAKHAMP